jgi:uncharacterized membrane protein YGL010W
MLENMLCMECIELVSFLKLQLLFGLTVSVLSRLTVTSRERSRLTVTSRERSVAVVLICWHIGFTVVFFIVGARGSVVG